MLASVCFLVAGLALMVKGADWLVDGATALARRAHISDLVIGMTIVAMGTSMPEFVVSVSAAVRGCSGIALGNVLGSNIANIFLILGIAGLLAPIAMQRDLLRRDLPVCILFSAVLLALLWFLHPVAVPRWAGLVLTLLFTAFLAIMIRAARNNPAPKIEVHEHTLAGALGFFALGLVLLVGGGDLTVRAAVTIAKGLGVSEELIGVTIVAVGTSLPEMATSIAGVLKKRDDIAMGNIVGSNIFNIGWILGPAALIRPIPQPEKALGVDAWIGLAAAILLLLVGVLPSRRRAEPGLGRAEAGILLACYAGYVAFVLNRR